MDARLTPREHSRQAPLGPAQDQPQSTTQPQAETGRFAQDSRDAASAVAPQRRPVHKTRRLMRRRVLHVLLLSDLDQVNASRVASVLCVSPSTLRRRLRAEGTSYQQLLDQVRRYRCEKTLAQRWLPGKCLAGKLGFSQPNSFYRAFGRWTGMTYTQYKRQQRQGSAGAAQRLY